MSLTSCAQRHEVKVDDEQIEPKDTIAIPAPIDGEIRIDKPYYSLSYNMGTKCPNWVAWHLTAGHADGSYKRIENFYEEEELPTPRATLEDYRGSGWSRGHMCPAGDNKWDAEAMYESFSLANVCPQNANLNSGLWNSIEMDCRRWARKFGDIYIVCGPLYLRQEHETIGYNKVYVPEAFFKVVLCLKGTPKGFGFIEMPNRPEAEAAIKALHDADVQGRKLRVNEAKNKLV